ncbi:hypothetical protein Mal52_30230 [Symmachiella dynata]|uniref:DUF2924 domain-containing protein n=1 Tax=Symmachiella dynata TaxID=2527995 RepID=A0A517ZQ18_9PLAN|nr:DUF2924 domain-containing protein [Symmachiella dynata]QDU44540.1 hypothetical protein Mal52_30230 [Symmachiella dynata]
MPLNIHKEVAAMRRMTSRELRTRFEELFGEACRSNHKTWLIKRIAWRLQANAEGDLSERARRRATELANDADLRLKPPQGHELSEPSTATKNVPLPQTHDQRIPMPGTVLTRNYKGGSINVTILDDGFEYEGETYKSLSAVAKAITGSHTNGFLFFRLDGKGASR